jgi:murein DD-endopeptidase MepM/ murein hydrolase activator NlpD
MVGTAGGHVTLPGYGDVTFAPGALSGDDPVSAGVTAESDVNEDFAASGGSFAMARLAYEFRVSTGTAPPNLPVDAKLVVPADFTARFSSQEQAAVFVRFWVVDGQESIVYFIRVASIEDREGGTVSLSIPPQAFTDLPNTTQSYEAVLIIAGMVFDESPAALPAGFRQAATSSSPDAGLQEPLQNFNLIAGRGFGANHKGVDAVAADGTPVYAAAFATGVTLSWDLRGCLPGDCTARNAPCSCCTGAGSGCTAVGDQPKQNPACPNTNKRGGGWILTLKHAGGLQTKYMHLKQGSPVTPSQICAGEQIALADFSGVVCGANGGAHLHFEVWQNGIPVDPVPLLVRPWRDIDCKGQDLHGQTCGGLGLGDGTLSCMATCQYDTSGCSGGGGGPPPSDTTTSTQETTTTTSSTTSTTTACDPSSHTCIDPCLSLNCDDGDPCTTDSCSNGACQHQPVIGGTWSGTYTQSVGCTPGTVTLSLQQNGSTVSGGITNCGTCGCCSCIPVDWAITNGTSTGCGFSVNTQDTADPDYTWQLSGSVTAGCIDATGDLCGPGLPQSPSVFGCVSRTVHACAQ